MGTSVKPHTIVVTGKRSPYILFIKHKTENIFIRAGFEPAPTFKCSDPSLREKQKLDQETVEQVTTGSLFSPAHLFLCSPVLLFREAKNLVKRVG
ncbi:hypothetical protein KAR34_08685, partial [bacterium]|nr:hypothetical protein [bacterium]